MLVFRNGRLSQDIGCGYCQPCPTGVNIPESFALFNSFPLFAEKRQAAFLQVLRVGGILGGGSGYASLCSHCRDCVQKCPQDLEVRTLLEQAVSEFEGDGLKEREANPA
jgi:predicted aldo/keto reductase-like oxidoreductase